MDSSYLVFDTKRNTYIRAGMTKVGMKSRRKDRVSTSLRNSHMNQSSKFYSCYPNPNCEKVNIPIVRKLLPE